MMRRRLGRLGRIALHTACAVLPPAGCPTVFASRHSDVERSEQLLQELADTGALSPTSFSLSVHNAIGAALGIARQDTHRMSAVSAGTETAAAAVVEAAGLLHDGAEEVVLVHYDDALPARYRAYADEPDAPYAWALRLTTQGDNMFDLRCEAGGTQTAAAGALPAGLAALAFLLRTGDEEFRQPGDNKTWVWRRHA